MEKLLYIPLFSLLLLVPFSFAKERKEDTTEYLSQLDDHLTFKKMTYIPTFDNINGVYARAIDKKIEDLIQKNHQWDFAKTHIAGAVIKPEDLIGNSKKVISFAKHLGADAFFTADTRKDPKGLQISLYLFSSKSGELVAEERVQRKQDSTPIVLASIEQMMGDIVKKIPYDALIVSRIDNRVTINAGSVNGVRPGQNLSCVKIISAERHPKRQFIVKSNKAILGQVRIVKADKYLSFADIISESEPGVLTNKVKVTGITQMNYGNTPWSKTYTPPEQLLSENNRSVFGKDAREWIAKDPPTFGKVGANFSIGSFNNNLSLSDGSSLDSKVPVYPQLNLQGEVWMTPQFYANARFAQGIGSSKNPSAGGDLSNSLTRYRLSLGYNMILKNEFFGPKFIFDIGFSSYNMFIDTSASQGFTSLKYTSVPIGIGGYTPLSQSGNWGIGGKAYFHMFPRLRETPFSSGASSDNNINQFIFFADNKLSQRLRLNLSLEFLLLSTSFSGQGDRPTAANNLSHRHLTFATGIDYLF